MQEYWEKYVKPIEGKKSIVSFNAGIADSVPDEAYMYVGFLKIKLNNPKEDGLVTEEETNDVGFIEDRLEMEALRWRSGKYIGRIISNGEVIFIYYLKLDFEWKNTIESTMSHFENYIYEFGSRIDIEWEVYLKLLFPTTREWQIIANHHACDNLKKQEGNLKNERAIEHKAYFTRKEDKQEFIKHIEKEGFIKNVEMEVPFQNKIMFGVKFYKKDCPSHHQIDTLTMSIIDKIEIYNGQYDGWETSIIIMD